MTTPADPWFQPLFADRIGGASYGKDTKIYKFEKIKRAKRAALAAHPERRLLDFGIGENDDMAPAPVREALKREADKAENRGYADNGIAAFKEAAAGFMKQVFGVALDPVTEVNHAIGSKPAYAMLPAVFINPGAPGYRFFSSYADLGAAGGDDGFGGVTPAARITRCRAATVSGEGLKFSPGR
jgi:LL-diaminopimelate aminotransferase